jgi:hypothetical protein
VSADPRVTRAAEILALYDGHGTWSAASAASVAGHLANVVRQLLDVITKNETDPAPDTFKCCDTPMPWPTKTEDRICAECGTTWEREPVDIGAGARIKEVIAEIETDPAARLAEVRAVLDVFDWEHDDRQYALEKIDRIVTGGAR